MDLVILLWGLLFPEFSLRQHSNPFSSCRGDPKSRCHSFSYVTCVDIFYSVLQQFLMFLKYIYIFLAIWLETSVSPRKKQGFSVMFRACHGQEISESSSWNVTMCMIYSWMRKALPERLSLGNKRLWLCPTVAETSGCSLLSNGRAG